MSNPVERRYQRNYFRDLRGREYLPHPFVKQTHCGACNRVWHTRYMRKWREIKRESANSL
jgi:hypothetical protein